MASRVLQVARQFLQVLQVAQQVRVLQQVEEALVRPLLGAEALQRRVVRKRSAASASLL